MIYRENVNWGGGLSGRPELDFLCALEGAWPFFLSAQGRDKEARDLCRLHSTHGQIWLGAEAPSIQVVVLGSTPGPQAALERENTGHQIGLVEWPLSLWGSNVQTTSK